MGLIYLGLYIVVIVWLTWLGEEYRGSVFAAFQIPYRKALED